LRLDAFANRIFVRPELPRRRLIDDDDWRSVGCVALVEVAALHHRNAHRAKVIFRNETEPGLRPEVSSHFRLAFDSEEISSEVAEGQEIGDRSMLHARHTPDALKRLLIESALPVGVGIFVLW